MGAKCKTILVSKVKGMLDVLEEVDKDFKLVKVSFQRWAGLNMTESCVSALKKFAKDYITADSPKHLQLVALSREELDMFLARTCSSCYCLVPLVPALTVIS